MACEFPCGDVTLQTAISLNVNIYRNKVNSEAFFPQVIPADLEESKSNATKRDVHCISECRERDYNQNTHLITKSVNPAAGTLGSRVVSIGFKLQP